MNEWNIQSRYLLYNSINFGKTLFKRQFNEKINFHFENDFSFAENRLESSINNIKIFTHTLQI